MPERDAECVARLRAAGATIVGKLNTHEFAFGALTNSPHFGAALQPVGPERTTGGSSGGSGAAVAAGLVDLALGTDTAGSIRIPAALCGVTGHRPTFGLVPVDGARPGRVEPRRGRAARPHRRGVPAAPGGDGGPRTAAGEPRSGSA